jgi:predicted nucleic acid-binding protein
MNAVFVDTGYLLALEIGNDQHHRAAMQPWQGVVSALPPLVTTSYVFDAVASRVQHTGVHGEP